MQSTHTHIVKAAENRKMWSPDLKVHSVVVNLFPTWRKYCIKVNLSPRGPWNRAPGGFFVGRGPLGLLSSGRLIWLNENGFGLRVARWHASRGIKTKGINENSNPSIFPHSRKSGKIRGALPGSASLWLLGSIQKCMVTSCQGNKGSDQDSIITTSEPLALIERLRSRSVFVGGIFSFHS